MNIFYLHERPAHCAKMHCDKHVVKMILEYAQLLCTAHHCLSSSPPTNLYKKTHENHPCGKWVRKSASNYRWLHSLWVELCREYEWRYGRQHKTFTSLARTINAVPDRLPDLGRTPLPLAMPDEYKCDNPVTAYRRYYIGAKAGLARWTCRPSPEWWDTSGNPSLL